MKKKQVSQWVKNFAQNYTVHKFLQNLYSTHYIFLYHTILSFILLELMQWVLYSTLSTLLFGCRSVLRRGSLWW